MSNLNIQLYVLNLFKKSKPLPLDKKEFSKWLTGFIDGEGNFQVFLDRNYLRVMFRVRLHKEDINLLKKYKNF